MKYTKVKLSDGGEYEIAYDDRCLVVKSRDAQVWISKAMAQWIALNFAPSTKIEIKAK